MLNHLATTTFCWLPPESTLNFRLGTGGLMWYSAMRSRTRARSSLPTTALGGSAARWTAGEVLRDRHVEQATVAAAVLRDERHTLADSVARALEPDAPPRSSIGASTGCWAPNSNLANSLRPEPSIPATPMTSPRSTVKDTSRSFRP